MFQLFDEEGAWTHFSDSDHAGNPEPAAKMKSQLSYVSMCGRVPIGWGSKGTSVNFDDRKADLSQGCNPSREQVLVFFSELNSVCLNELWNHVKS